MENKLLDFDFIEEGATIIENIDLSFVYYEGHILFKVLPEKEQKIVNMKDLISKKNILDKIASGLESDGLGLFAAPLVLKEVQDKIKIGLSEEDNGDEYLWFDLAVFLGLPNINPKEELQEFKNFLLEIKKISIEKELFNDVFIFLDRDSERTVLELKSLKNTNEDLNIYFQKKIKDSKVLSFWSETVKKGFENTAIHCDCLYNKFSITSLYDKEDNKVFYKYLEDKKNNEKQDKYDSNLKKLKEKKKNYFKF